MIINFLDTNSEANTKLIDICTSITEFAVMIILEFVM